MANETRYRYLWTMDKADEQQLFTELAAIGAERAALETALEALADQSRQAAKDALRRGMKPSRVAKALRYTDGYVRKLRTDAKLPPDPRYADLQPPSRRKDALAAPPTSLSQPPSATGQPRTRADELREFARALSDASALRVADELAVRHGRWLTVGNTPRETIDNAIRANLVTASDLR